MFIYNKLNIGDKGKKSEQLKKKYTGMLLQLATMKAAKFIIIIVEHNCVILFRFVVIDKLRK